ncbi:MAG: Glycosyl transferase family 2 [Limisphaerales bacterium]|nr:MAG: Glycosyl transferase family 2 [Limisphaerales bacterium]KAG0506644.1 MAG: Glycosyl transferase family 2 [Limisphaerales bacterium]TXT44532.1 MAG: Glycosyl transferase family 2 [Limisphaerales bacterium]
MSVDAWQLLFWFSFAALAYTFLGYPLLIGALAKAAGMPVKKSSPANPPAVSVVLVAFNEEERIVPRVANLLAANYPADKLEVLVVTDGSTDGTVAKLRALADPRVRVLAREQRSGKSACLNAAIPQACGEIVVLCDARQRFAPHTIPELVANFSDPDLGAVSGSLEIDPAATGVGGGVDLYWRLEKFIRASEGRFSSTIGATGAVYALRRELFQPIPDDTLLDDVVIPLQIAVNHGKRITFDPTAPAYDPQTTDPAKEKRRKMRTLAGNFQMLAHHPGWLLPWRTGLWWQLLSHKYSRIVAPVFMVTMFASNAALAGAPLYREIFCAHVAFYALALLGLALPMLKWKPFSIPAGFVFLNLMTVGGLVNWLRGAYRQGKW